MLRALLIILSSLLSLPNISTDPDKVLNELHTVHKIVGVAAGYSVQDQKRWTGCRGSRCRKEVIPFTDTTLTRSASLAKPMTAVAVMQLVERGLLDLDRPIRDYLPDFPEKEKGAITTRQLLSHTSGLSQYQNTKEVENKTYYPTLEDAMRVFQDRPLLFEPGTDFFYTSYGYVILGRLIEVLSGQNYGDYMQTHIWDKAGMRHTGIERLSDLPPNRSCLYHRKRKKAKMATANDLSNRIPGGGLYTNLQDMLLFGEAVLNHTLITETSFEQMCQNQFPDKEGNPYGLGWSLYGPAPHFNLVIGHAGEQTGAANQLMLIPKSGTVVVVLSNTSGCWKEVVQACSDLVAISEREHPSDG